MPANTITQPSRARLRGSRIVVTGGAGFIGSHLVDTLVGKGADVLVLDDLSTGTKINVNCSAKFVRGDVTDIRVVRECLRDSELVYHLAADATTRESSMGWLTPEKTLRVNTVGTLNVLEAVVKLNQDTRIVFASSAAVYGEPVFTPVTEQHQTNPISPYGVSKLAGEKLVLAYFLELGVKTNIVRIFNTYGPRQSRYVIFELLKKLQADQTRLEVLGNEKIVRDYCYVSDLVRGILLVSEGSASGEIYNISGENPVTIGDLVQVILRQLGLAGRTKVRYTGRSWKGDITKMVADTTRIGVLGFRPVVDLEEGIRLMIDSEWWQAESKGADGII